MSRRDRDRDLDRELAFHVEQHAEDLMALGIEREEAHRRARMKLGGLEQVREECRDVRPWRWLGRLADHVRYSVRGMRKSLLSTLALIVTVAVCIALNTAVFTVVDSLILRPLPFERADRLVFLTNQYPNAGITDQDGSAAGDYLDRKGAISAVAEHALYWFVADSIDSPDGQNRIEGLAVTPSFFPLLRVRTSRGRAFTESESEPGNHLVAILTDGLSHEIFGDGDAIGREMRLSGRSYTVVGVLPPGFRFLSPRYRYFVPLALSSQERRARHNNSFQYLGRLQDGATVAQAQNEVDALNAALLQQLPELKELLTNSGFRTRVSEFQPWLMRRVRPGLELLWAGALLVLFIGAVNLAGLSLARAGARAKEIATRLALGASNAHLAGLCIIENVLPALLGATLGMPAGILALRVFDRELLPGASEIQPDWTVIGYALSGAVVAGTLAGVASLIPFRRLVLAQALHEAGRGSTARTTRLRRGLVISQVAIAFVLLYGAGVLTSSLRELMRVDPGFRVGDVWTASTHLPGTAYPHTSDLRLAMGRMLSSARDVSGVESVAAASAVPFSSSYDDNVILPRGYAVKQGESAISPVRMKVTPGYFEVMGLPALRGRTFDDRDSADAQRVVIIDERLANRFWPGQDAVGRRLYYPGAPSDESMTVVGVVRSIRLENLAGTGNPNGVYYTPWSQATSRAFTIVWRGGEQTISPLRKAVARALPAAAVFDVRSMAGRQELTLAPQRVAQLLVLVFAVVAVLLAAIGIYGLLAFLLNQRRREVGIRVAMGCGPAGVFRLFMRDGLTLSVAGVGIGLAIGAAGKPWIAAQLYGVRTTEPVVIALAATLLTLVAVSAACIPAWRASRLDPTRVLGEN